jgi:hypothetical protein
MSVEIMLPRIGADSPRGQIEEIKSYLYRLAEELGWALSRIEESVSDLSERERLSFERMKPLIMSSAEIASSYYGSISRRLEGKFASRGEFGDHVTSTTLTLEANSREIAQLFERLDKVSSATEGMSDTLTSVTAHIRSGYLGEENGSPVYGVEIGQKTLQDGNEVFNRFARFSAGRLTFYDGEGNEQAYISDRRLYVSAIELPQGEMGPYRLADLTLPITVAGEEMEIGVKRWSDGRLEGMLCFDMMEAGVSRLTTSGTQVSLTLPQELEGAKMIVTLDCDVSAAASVNTLSGVKIRAFAPVTATPKSLWATVHFIKEV